MAKLTKLDDFVCAQYLMALHRGFVVFSFELILFLSGFEIHFSPIICYFNARSATCIGYYIFFFWIHLMLC